MAENGPEFNAESLGVSTEEAGRRLVSPIFAERRMNMYMATDNELESLSFINSLSIAYFSIGSFLLSWPINIWIELSLSTPPEDTKVLLARIAGSSLVLATVFFGFGIYSLCKGKTIIKTIKKEAVKNRDQ